jgi:HD-GYP domain-containing protein (c-di-GMP phosphodiesterase class II)
MSVFQLPPDVLRVGEPTPFALRDKTGCLLVPRGLMVSSEDQLQQLAARDLYVDEQDGEALRRAIAGKLDSMVRQNALLGAIAQARPDPMDIVAQAKGAGRRREDPLGDWSSQQLRISAVLHDTTLPDFTGRLTRVQAGLLDLLNNDIDTALLILVHGATQEFRDYSVRHAMLVAVVCELAARHTPAWNEEMRPSLRCAALTMNIAMTQVQNQLAVQDTPVTQPQLDQIDKHGKKGASRMREAGVTDELWLGAVEHHHDTPPGPLANLSAAKQLSRLIQRADIFAARLSPRKKRPAMSATAAAKAVYLDEFQKPDEAGSAIIKAIGLHPPGCLVRLRSGEVALVLRQGKRPTEPVVAAVVNAKGTAIGEPMLRNTALSVHEVVAGVAAHECKVRLSLDRLIKLT